MDNNEATVAYVVTQEGYGDHEIIVMTVDGQGAEVATHKRIRIPADIPDAEIERALTAMGYRFTGPAETAEWGGIIPVEEI